MLRLGKRAVAASLATAAIATGGVVSVASPASADPCGYFTTGSILHPGNKYYNHCGSAWTEVLIKRSVLSNYYRCLPPGTTKLQDKWDVPNKHIVGATSHGDPCW